MLIAIDHGNKQIKTVHAKPFTSGLIQSDAPGFGTDYLAYQGKFYALTDQRIPYRRDKTEDERFFILTLFAIVTTMTARILAIREIASKNIAKYVSLLKVSGVASLYY